MKKNKVLLVILLLSLTGCTCKYDLTIDGDNFKEAITIHATSNDEKNSFYNEWEIATDKEEYGIGLDDSDEALESIVTSKYDYLIDNDNLIFNHTFNRINYSNSSAISNCFDTVTTKQYENTIIISTSEKVLCFEKYRDMTELTINITVDRPVISHNADNVNNNTYTWVMTNNSSKGINIILENELIEDTTNSASQETDTKDQFKLDTDMYIFALILFAVLLIGYAIVRMVKNQDDDLSDE